MKGINAAGSEGAHLLPAQRLRLTILFRRGDRITVTVLAAAAIVLLISSGRSK